MPLFPAHAGVIPFRRRSFKPSSTIPRTRGGDPNMAKFTVNQGNYSPHTRG